MAYLEINNFAVGAQINSATANDDGPRFQARMYDGSVFRDEVRDVQRWEFVSGLIDKADRDQLRHLIRGDGEHWSFDSDQYGSKGTGISAGTYVISATDPKFGAGRIEPSTTITFAPAWLSNVDPWTVAYWRDETAGPGASWKHVVVNSSGQKWEDGVRNDSLDTSELSVSSAEIDLTTAYEAYDDLVILPWAITPAFGDAYPQSYAYPDLPKVRLDGDAFEDSAIVAMGQWNGWSEIAGPTVFYRGAFALWED